MVSNYDINKTVSRILGGGLKPPWWSTKIALNQLSNTSIGFLILSKFTEKEYAAWKLTLKPAKNTGRVDYQDGGD